MRVRTWLVAATAMVAATALIPAAEAGPPLKVAVIEDTTGPLEAYAKQDVTGLKLGIEYATHGTDTVAGRKIVLIEKDSQTKPDLGRSLLTEAYEDDGAEIAIGGTSSAVALAMLPVAREEKKVFIVSAAVADSITGKKWNRYIFRVDRNSSQDAISNAVAIGRPGLVIGTLAQDYAFGHDGVAAFKKALAATGAKVVAEEFPPGNTTDFTAPMQRLFDALNAQKAPEKVIAVIWAGANPMGKLAALDPQRFGIKLGTGGNILPVLKLWNTIPSLEGMEGATYYYYGIPKNPVNDWLVKTHEKRFGAPPDFFTANGMAAGMALVTALEKTKGVTDADTLIKAMEGMAFETPKGKMIFRAQDHQALQSMYAFRLHVDPKQPWAVPVLTRELTIKDMNIPIENGR